VSRVLDIVEVPWPEDLPAAVAEWAAGSELAWLDSPADVCRFARHAEWSFLAIRPIGTLEQFDGAPARLWVDGSVRDADANGWQLWRRTLTRLPTLVEAAGLSPLSEQCPFSLGWVGYVGFEMARQLERLPASHTEDLGLPLLRMALFDRAIILDHGRRRALAMNAPALRAAVGLDDDAAATDGWQADLARWASAARCRPDFAWPVARLRAEQTRAAHERAVARALEYIAAGDIYQVNLAQRLRLEGLADHLAAYRALRRGNPAPYSAFLRWPGAAVASVSPELFLRASAGRVLTSPIKGTRPRTGDAALDLAAQTDLLQSAKEAAELAMIVDLHRNDLGRVCRYGSVQVACPRRLEAHPTVFHTVADVVGRLAPQRDGLDLLKACFPAGSISGVPKIRALEIIDELEPVARGVYTGAVGAYGLDGRMCFNVAIRTLQMCGSTATLYVGGGIVADSDPAAEYDETLAKGRGIIAALTAPDALPSHSGSPRG